MGLETDTAVVEENVWKLSYSRVSMYFSCPQKWYYRYVKKIITRMSLSLAFGSVVHKVLDAFNAGMLPEVADIDEANARAWDAITPAIHKEDQPTPEDRALSAALLRTYAQWPSRPKVVDTEVYREVPLPDGTHTLRGFIDGLTPEGVVVEYKTSAASWSDDKLALELQPWFYAHLLTAPQTDGLPVVSHTLPVHTLHVILVKTKKPKIESFRTTIHRDPAPLVHRLTAEYIRATAETPVLNATATYAPIVFPSRGVQCAWCDYTQQCLADHGHDSAPPSP